jgi:hypothetical protein
MRRLFTLVACAALTTGCALGYANEDTSIGFTLGQSSVTACHETADPTCKPTVQGGAISEVFSGLLGRALSVAGGAVTGAGAGLAGPSAGSND